MAAICPICNKDDQIQKVSSIFQQGTAKVNVISDGTNSSPVVQTESQTNLAKRLAPPSLPSTNAQAGIWSSIFIGALFAFLISTFTNNWRYFFWILIGIAVVGIVLFTWVSQNAFNEAKPVYEKEIKIWNELYYCYRDDCVFSINSNKSVPIENIKDLYK